MFCMCVAILKHIIHPLATSPNKPNDGDNGNSWAKKLLDIPYRPMYFCIYPYPYLLSPICTVQYNRGPVTSGTPHV